MKFTVELTENENKKLEHLNNRMSINADKSNDYFFEVCKKEFTDNMRGDDVVNVEFINKKVNKNHTMLQNCGMNKKASQRMIIKKLKDISEE